ncbi:hypothetical protein BRD56_05370 [Thermoplasmatales archaeon SW_10_69_26]|nr:MAG: hypothetical protein BRD56_05370 [Thermoplasmatales archaeon SW_10_69_26]
MNQLKTAAEHLQRLRHERDVRALCQHLLGFDPSPRQQEIIEAIAYEDHDRLAITAPTRYGKTLAVAAGLCLLILLNDEPIGIGVISATKGQAKKMRDYVAEFVVACPLLEELLELDVGQKDVERLTKEVSREKLTFQDGKTFEIHSAHGKANRVMGEGEEVLVIEECALIDDDTYREKVRRMAEGALYEISNPWSKHSEFFNSWQSDRYHNIQVLLEDALKEYETNEDWGVDPDLVEEQRERLDEITFTVQYESRFPDDVEDTLVKWSWIVDAVEASPPDPDDHPVDQVQYGMDVANEGTDSTVLIRVEWRNSVATVTHVWSWQRADTQENADRAEKRIRETDGLEDWDLGVDAVGEGKGTYDEMADRFPDQVHDFKGSRKPSKKERRERESLDADEYRFKSIKHEAHWHTRDLFEDGAIRIPDHADLRQDCSRSRYEIKRGKVHVHFEDEDNDSPDHFDALTISLFPTDRFASGIQVEPAWTA